MRASEFRSLLRSKPLAWCLAGAGVLAALNLVLEGAAWFALSPAGGTASVDLITAAAWLWATAAWVALCGFGAATWEAFVASGHGELLAWRAAGVIATFVLALGALLTATSVSGTPGDLGGSSSVEAAGVAIWAVLVLAGAARLVVAAGPGQPGGRRPVPEAVAGLALGAAGLVAATVALLLPPPTLLDSTSGTVSQVLSAIGFGLGALALVKVGLVEKVPYLLAGLVIAAAARLGDAIAIPLLYQPTATATDFRIGFGIPSLVLAAGCALAGLAALVAAGSVLPLAPAQPAAAEADQRVAAAPPSLRRCEACDEPASASARFCAGCGRAL